MTKRELSQLYYLNREIEQSQARIRELETVATSCTAQISGMPHASGVSDKIGKYAAEIADLRALQELNLQKCFYEYSRLLRYINNISDSEIRQIMTFRYINGLSWHQVAKSIGENDESYPRRRHNRFLEKSEKCSNI